MKITLLLGITHLLTAHVSAVLAVQTYDANQHHRFADHPDFIGDNHDWSGVARASNGRWVTMISATYFISSNHASPAALNTVTFHTDNDPAGPTVTRTVGSVVQIGSTDIQLGRLTAAPGPTVATYSIASETTDETSFGSSVYSEMEVFNVGLNNTGSGTTQFRVGRNVLDGFYDTVVEGPRTAEGITFDDDRGTIDSLGADETYLQGGDSGAPMFTTSGSDLVLIGNNWFIEPSADPKFSGTSFLPNHISAISAIVTAGGESLTLVSVPEPASAAFLGLSAAGLIFRRKKS